MSRASRTPPAVGRTMMAEHISRLRVDLSRREDQTPESAMEKEKQRHGHRGDRTSCDQEPAGLPWASYLWKAACAGNMLHPHVLREGLPVPRSCFEFAGAGNAATLCAFKLFVNPVFGPGTQIVAQPRSA